MMRKLIAKILYLFFYKKIEKSSLRQDAILSIYGHDQQKEPFEKLIAWLVSRDYVFITPEKVYSLISGDEPLDKKYVWLSFDDGWKSGYDNVLPVLEKYQIPATFFIASKGIEDGYYWYSRAFQNRESDLYKEVDELWKIPNKERSEIIDRLPAYKGSRITMNEEELLKLKKSGFANFGNHTHDHVMSDKCTRQELSAEIDKCSLIMKNITGDDCSFIYSYPNGNLDANSVGVIKEKDFKLAATVKIGWINRGDNPYDLHRNEFNNGCLEENLLQIYGLWTPFFNRIKRFLGIKNRK
ncbi:MAG: polysaccharide deacetylase family protein [Bacteroidales bacterium]|jgi:peptidoglycan/xylan/chitin deacetylase (PgdA/CDA1 family)|nr:polysaccharide deacetylase family protein [Bacteroidales bacterium]